MAANLWGRYVWLVDTLLHYEKLTYEEINRLWKRSGLSYGESDELPLRTFHNHRNAIKDIFDIYIECDTKDGYRYYIDQPESLMNDGLRDWLVSSYATLNQIQADKKLEGRIIFENVPSGRIWLTTITNAMRLSQVLLITYRGFEQTKPSQFEIEPYYLKVVNRRWYVIVRNPELSEKERRDVYRSYALDRITDIEETEKTFEMNKHFDINSFFQGCCGIITSDEPVQRVVIKSFEIHPEYLRTLPLHPSQKEIERNDEEEYAIFEYHVKPTFDFYQLLLAQGDQIEVLKPASVRSKMREFARNLMGYYER